MPYFTRQYDNFMFILFFTALHALPIDGYSFNSLWREHHKSKFRFTELYSSNVGKGDDTIKVLNQLETIVIDSTLTSDPAFWD